MDFFEDKANVLVKICVTVAILAVIGFIVFFIMNAKDEVVTSTEIKYEYFPMYSLDEKVGVVDKTGKIVIEPKYLNVYIPNPEIDVFACELEDKIFFVNASGDVLFEQYENVSVIKMSETSGEVERNVLTYKDGEKYGLIDILGNKLTDAKYEEIKSLDSRPGMILVKRDNKYGLINEKGTIIIQAKYNAIKSDGYSTEKDGYNKTGYIVSERTNNGIIYGYINYEGKVLIEPKYESIKRANKQSDDIYLIVMERGKKGVIRNTKSIIKNNYQSVSYAEIADIFVVEKVGKYGFFSIEGDEILKPAYPNYVVSKEYITVEENDKIIMYDFFGNVVKTNNFASVSEVEGTSYLIAKSEEGYYSIISKDVNVNNKYTQLTYAFDDYFVFTNEEGKSGVLHVWTGEVIEPKYEYIIPVDGSKALEARDENNKLFIFDKNLKEVFALDDGIVQRLNDEYTVIYSDYEKNYLNKNGDVVQNKEVYPNNKLYSVLKDGKWGFENAAGEFKVPCKYDLVTELNEFGFAGVKQDDKWGVINEKGEEIVVPMYEIDAYYFPKFVGKYQLQQNETLVVVELEEK